MVANISSSRRGGSGFSTGPVIADARRQLRLSIGLVAVLAVGIVSAAVSIGPHPIAAKRAIASAAPVVTVSVASDPVGAEPI